MAEDKPPAGPVTVSEIKIEGVSKTEEENARKLLAQWMELSEKISAKVCPSPFQLCLSIGCPVCVPARVSHAGWLLDSASRTSEA